MKNQFIIIVWKRLDELNNEFAEYNITNDGNNMINKDKYIYLHINS